MDNGLCLYVNLITFILSLIFGFWTGVVHDRKKRRAKAYLSIYSPVGYDSINGLIIQNNTGGFVTDIRICIRERKKIYQRLFSQDVLRAQKTIVLLKDTESSSIFEDNCGINRNDFSKIKVNVKYWSTKFEKEIEMSKSFNRI